MSKETMVDVWAAMGVEEKSVLLRAVGLDPAAYLQYSFMGLPKWARALLEEMNAER